MKIAKLLGTACVAICIGGFLTFVLAGPTVLTDAQKNRMSECLDQQSGQGTPGAADACAQFKPSSSRNDHTVLTERERARMSECLDQQSGQATPGVADTCVDFVRSKHSATATAAPAPTGGSSVGTPHPEWLAMPVLVYAPGGRQMCCMSVRQIDDFFHKLGDNTALTHNNGDDGFVLLVMNHTTQVPYQLEFFEPSKRSRSLPRGAVLQNFYVGEGNIYAGGRDVSLMMTLGGKGSIPDTTAWLTKNFNLH